MERAEMTIVVYKSFGAMANAMQRNMERVAVAFAKTSLSGAKLVQAVAKHKIGVYQPEVGPFPEWEELADSTEFEKARLGYPVDAPLLREGNLRDSIVYECTAMTFLVGSESKIAIYQEFGTKTIPPRPFIGPALFETMPDIMKIFGNSIERALSGENP